MTSKQSIREKTQKLKIVSDNMQEEVVRLQDELASLQQFHAATLNYH